MAEKMGWMPLSPTVEVWRSTYQAVATKLDPLHDAPSRMGGGRPGGAGGPGGRKPPGMGPGGGRPRGAGGTPVKP